jgi:outer membrane protein W
LYDYEIIGTVHFEGTTGALKPYIGIYYRYEFFRAQFYFSQLLGLPSLRWGDDVPVYQSKA